MKRKSVKLVPGVILAVLLLAISPALGDASAESDIELAKEIARVEVAKNAGDYPEWEGAEATGGQPYCDVEGNVICYWFAVSKEGKVLGSVVVGSSLYEHAIFQVGSGSPPPIPTADEVCSSVEKCLGLEVAQKDIGEPLRLVYVTYSFYFAVYDIEGQLIGIDLVRKEAVPASELMMMIASPEQYRQYKEGRVKPLGGGKSLNLSVPLKDMADYELYDDHENNNNCGPTSGSMIVVYHRNETGYTNFDDWTECHSVPDPDHPENGTGLYYTMKCNDPLPGVTWTDAGPGWTAYARYCGYSFNYNHGWAQLDSYEAIMTYINQGNPLMIMFASDPNYTNWHWCVIKGYEQDGADQIRINDPHYFSIKLPWELHYPYTWLTAISPGNYAALDGHVSFPARGTPPDDRWREKLEVRFFDSTSQQEMRWSPVSATTSRYGYFYLGNVPPSTYDIGIKNWTCLSELETGVVLYGGEVTEVDFGTLIEADCNNNDKVDGYDYSMVLNNYGVREIDDPAFWATNELWKADFNRDKKIDSFDYASVLNNHGKKGDIFYYTH
jgi:hypothetical protein